MLKQNRCFANIVPTRAVSADLQNLAKCLISLVSTEGLEPSTRKRQKFEPIVPSVTANQARKPDVARGPRSAPRCSGGVDGQNTMYGRIGFTDLETWTRASL
jgi:hypothetical protein